MAGARLLRGRSHLERMEEFRQLIASEIRRRLAERRRDGATPDASFNDGPIEDVDFLGASPAELRSMRQAIRPLAQKLAARMARRRRFRRRGRLDVRKTLRRSLSAGGVPLDPAFRHPRASKPDLYLLCDISGSVSEFARFTMSLLHAVKEEFSRIRLFAFVDGVDEVTELLDTTGHELAPRNLLYGTKVIAADGHSDYGNVFRRFWHLYGYADLDPRATVIITGDARNNYRDPGVEALSSIAERARKVYWLNPEAPERLEHERLDHGHVRRPMPRRLRDQELDPARRFRGADHLMLATRAPSLTRTRTGGFWSPVQFAMSNVEPTGTTWTFTNRVFGGSPGAHVRTSSARIFTNDTFP